MPLFPTHDTLHNIFHPAVPTGRQETSFRNDASYKRTPLEARAELYPTWSSIDDAKNKASALSAEAAKEFEKASAKAQAKAGSIELYSAKYYAACTFGGLMACGLTHTAVTPLDLVKCRRQVDSKMYTGNFQVSNALE